MSFLIPKTNIRTESEKINSFQATKCEFGTLPIAYGTCKMAPNVINYLDFSAEKVVNKVRTGKRSSSTSIDYKYKVYCELALCEGAIDGIGKIDVGSNTYDSLDALNQSNDNEGSGLALNRGDDPNPTDYMLGNHSDIAVGYPNVAYLYGMIYLGHNTANMPSYNVEVFGKLRETGDGVDANPSDVIIDLLNYVGLGDYIDVDSFNNYRKYCKEADLLISTPMGKFDEQKTCQSVIAELLKLTNAYMFWSVDKFKIVVRDDRRWGTWQPNRQIIYALNEDHFIPNGGVGVSFARKDSSEIYNRFGVSFTNRENNGESETVFLEDTDSIIDEGVKASPVLDASWFHTKARAIKIADMQARINRNENIKYTFKLPMSFSILECGDLVSITDSAIGISNQVCMIDSITEDSKGYLNVIAIKRADGIYSTPIYKIDKIEYNSINFNLNPYNTASPIFIQPPQELITSSSGLELWVALHGEHPNWGGCNVMVSDQDGGYTQMGVHPRSSVFGYILNNLTEESESVIVKATNPTMIEMLTGSEWDADQDNTLIWIDGEFISYERAEIVDVNTYELFGLLRGRFGTKVVNHPINSSIVSCDSDIYVVEIPRHYANRTLYFKFPAFNYFGQNVQSIENLPYYTANAVGESKPPTDVITLDTELLSNGVRRFWWNYDYGNTRDTAGFEIRYIQGNFPSWENGTQLHTGLLTSQPFETDAIRQGIHTVMIKAISTDGSESNNPAYAVLNLGEPLEDNVLYRKKLSDNNWSEVHHDGLVLDGKLVQKDISDFWTNKADTFWKTRDGAFWNGKFSEINITWETVAPASGQMWFSYVVSGNFRLEYRIVDESIPITEDDPKSLWKPYTCKVEVKAGQIIQVRAFTGASGEATIIDDITMIIDVVDRVEHFENIQVTASGVELPIKTPNYYTTSVRLDAVQGNVLANRIEIVNRQPCVIKLLDTSGGTLSATVDVTWQGFIKEIL